ncbi:MAG: hypothetical protein JST58_04615 [Bacteroidetes bacterium]|jgi:hypothetical protein|nr:hypothetical protein [Bacteroidota bacterium]
MKPFIVILFMLTMCHANAQFSGSSGMIKATAGYTHDFPGLNGYTVGAEYSFPLTEILQGSMGLKHADMQGFPRSSQAFEFTKATTLDFNMYWAPLRTENQLFRVGLGYSFSFYNIQRAYPLVVDYATGKSTTWPTYLEKGRANGINVVAEYEYKLPSSHFSVGVRGALYKAYTETKFIGAVVGYEL